MHERRFFFLEKMLVICFPTSSLENVFRALFTLLSDTGSSDEL